MRNVEGQMEVQRRIQQEVHRNIHLYGVTEQQVKQLQEYQQKPIVTGKQIGRAHV